jgi:hypothetical protein
MLLAITVAVVVVSVVIVVAAIGYFINRLNQS